MINRKSCFQVAATLLLCATFITPTYANTVSYLRVKGSFTILEDYPVGASLHAFDNSYVDYAGGIFQDTYEIEKLFDVIFVQPIRVFDFETGPYRPKALWKVNAASYDVFFAPVESRLLYEGDRWLISEGAAFMEQCSAPFICRDETMVSWDLNADKDNNLFTINIIHSVPEPGSLGLFTLGVAGLLMRRRVR